MDAYEALLRVESDIAEFESSEDFHDGDQKYQRLLEERDELRAVLEREAEEIWNRRTDA